MSSILDALKKLEAEKAKQADEQERVVDEPFRPDRASEELIGVPSEHKGTPVVISPRALVAGGIVFAVVLIGISVTVSLMVARSNVPPPVVAMNTSPPPAVLPSPAPQAVSSPPPSAEETPKPIAQESPKAETAEAPAVPKEPVQESKPAPVSVSASESATKPTTKPPAVVADKPAKSEPPATAVDKPVKSEPPAPAPLPVEEAPVPSVAPVPVLAAAAPETSATIAPPTPPPAMVNTTTPGPVELKKLPVLRSAERARYGLENMRLNVLRETAQNRPHGLAIINLNKVYIGEVIPGTRARLIEVKSHGIGIEIVDTGERFYVPH